MTPQEAQYRLKTYGGQVYVAPIYKQMTEGELQALVDECEKPSLEQRLDRMPIPKLGYNALDRALGRETPEAPEPAAAPPATAILPKALAKALADPRRVNTAGRQRAAFLRQLQQCGSVAEAAERARVNRGSLYRWRARDARFAEKWDAAIARHAAEVADDIALQANTVEVQPVFYRGKQIGERRKVNTRLMMHVQNRSDAERRRAEDRAERRELLLLRAELAERSLEKRQSATPVAAPAVAEMCCQDLGLAAAA